MKKKAIIYILSLACLGAGVVSCEDMLTPSSDRHSYEVGQDTLYSYWGILRSLQNVAERYVVLGECRGELVSGTAYLSDSIQPILNFDMANATDGSCRYLKVSDYYHVINSCNAYLAYYNSSLVTGTKEPYMEKEAVQVRAIRAWTYLQLVQVYGEVPFYTEPLLSTDAIDQFWNNGNYEKVSADNIADKLAPDLDASVATEMEYGYPQYQSYGYTYTVCHSTKAMIPVNLILGDLYLTQGDQASCQKAAQYYYNYLSANQNASHIEPGGALPNGYYCYGYKREGETQTTYAFPTGSSPWTETGAQSRTLESITAIPSSTNKLWGTVLRGVNELFGYDSEISVRTSEEDTTTTASITLTPQYNKKQLIASNAYYDLCDAQDFEMYIGTDYTTSELTVDPNVGDARQYWVQDVSQTYSNGLRSTEKFVTKQNPNGQFTTVYPMIYRKSQVWLRYAEALCRAGFPSYAFAILKDGLCNNSLWYPTAGTTDYEVKEWEFSYTDDEKTYTSNVSKQAVVDQVMSSLTFEDDDEYEAALEEISASVDSTALSFYNWPSETCGKVLDYLDQREALKAGSYLNFNVTTFSGNFTSVNLVLRTSLTDSNANTVSTSSSESIDEAYTDGIHSRGCGYVKFYDRGARAYNYVDMVTKKAKENYGVTLTKEDIYGGDYDETVIKCVEDLIVDEEALELAFEGTRFFDLMRVAHRRHDPSYLANKLGLRNSELQSKLLNEKNWYFPLPQY